MPEANENRPSGPVEEARRNWRDNWRDILLDWIKLPLIILLGVVTDGYKNLFTHPGHAAWVIIPLAVLSVLVLNPRTMDYFRLPWLRIGILSTYVLVFFLIVQAGFLDWKQPLVGYEDLPRNFLNLDRYGDWLYRFAPKARNSDFTVVLKKHPQDIEERRLQIADLIELAAESDAKGLALDFYFGDEAKGIDQYLCDTINEAKTDGETKQMPVFIGYDFEVTANAIKRLPGSPTLDKCLHESSRGHALGYEERDGVIRSIPLYREDNPRYPALSVKAATEIAGDKVAKVEKGLLQFVRPKNDFEELEFDKLWNDYKADPKQWEEDQKSLRDRLVFVGEESDRFETPYGNKYGAVIHAYAAHSLTQNYFIKRYRWWTSLPIIFVVGYLLMSVELHNRGKVKRLLGLNIAFSFTILLFSILSMLFSLNWIEITHSLLAIWLFLIPLAVVTKIRSRRKPRPEISSEPPLFPADSSQRN